MEKKKNKDPCAGCVWRLWIGTSEKVLCPFPSCKRAEYDKLIYKQDERHEEKTPNP